MTKDYENEDTYFDEYLQKSPGSIKSGMEYKEIAEIINESYECDMSAQQIQKEMRKSINKLFSVMIEQFPDRLFDVVQVFSEEFKIPEDKFVRYLNNRNMEMLRNYADNNYETYYYKKKEKEKLDTKRKSRGEKITERDELTDLFE